MTNTSNEPAPTPRQMWEARYAKDGYIFGTEPNDFLRDQALDLPVGDALCLAEGEGRNSVFLAGLGHRVSSVDLAEAGVAKTLALAADRGVEVAATVGDLADYDLGAARWDLVVSIFAHTPPPVRRRLHQNMAAALKPGGRFVLEAYTPAQIGRGTGGPQVPELTMQLAELREDLAALELLHAVEMERTVIEGPGHTGVGSVVQVVARKPL